MNLKKAFEPQRRKERKGKARRYRNFPGHPIGEYQMDFMPLFSLRLRVFAVNELWF
jgi:hypothetical protein